MNSPYDWRFDYSLIPEETKAGLKRYEEQGIPPGDFLRCVLENDLHGAVGHADMENIRVIVQIVCYIHNEVRAPSGYKGCVKEHCERKARLLHVLPIRQPGHVGKRTLLYSGQTNQNPPKDRKMSTLRARGHLLRDRRKPTILDDLIYDLLLEGEPLWEGRIHERLRKRGRRVNLGDVRTAILRLEERGSIRRNKRWANRWEVV